MATVAEQHQLVLDFTAPPAPAVEAACARCGEELLPTDRRQHRSLCKVCRQKRALELAAERDFASAPRPATCRCDRPFLVTGGCIKCGRRRAR